MLNKIVRNIYIVVFALLPVMVVAYDIDPLLPDYRVILDNSTDVSRTNIESSLRMLPHKIPSGSVSGIVAYSDISMDMIAPGVVDSNWRRKVSFLQLPEPKRLKQKITDVIRYAARTWIHKDRSYNRNIVLITSGRLSASNSTSVEKEVAADLKYTLVPFMKERGIVLNVINIGSHSSQDLAEAAVMTGGLYFHNLTNEQFLRSLGGIFGDDSSEVSSGTKADNNIVIGKNSKDVTFIFSKTSPTSMIRIQSPDGKVYQADQKGRGIRWLQSGKKEIVTIHKAKAGTWKVIGNLSGDSPIKVYKNINLRLTNSAENYYIGEKLPIQVSVYSDEGLVQDEDFFNSAGMDLVLYDDEESIGTMELSDNLVRNNMEVPKGYYNVTLDSSTFPNTKTDKEIKALLFGRTIKAELKQKLEILESPFAIEQETEVDSTGKKKLIFTIKMLSDDIDQYSVRLKIHVSDNKGRSFPASTSLIKSNEWRFYLLPSKDINKYSVRINATCKSKSGRDIDILVDDMSVVVPDVEIPDPEIIYKEVLVNNASPEIITIEKEKKITGKDFAIGFILLLLTNILIPAIWFGAMFFIKNLESKDQQELEAKFLKNSEESS